MPPASTMHPVVLLHSSLLIAVLHCSRVEVGGNVAKRDDRALAESEWKHCYAVTVISSPQTLESESEHQKIKRQVWMSQAKCGEIVRSLEYMRMKGVEMSSGQKRTSAWDKRGSCRSSVYLQGKTLSWGVDVGWNHGFCLVHRFGENSCSVFAA